MRNIKEGKAAIDKALLNDLQVLLLVKVALYLAKVATLRYKDDVSKVVAQVLI